MKQLLRDIGQHLKSDRRAAAAVVIAIVANVLLASLYVWSRGGQTTTVEVVASGQGILVYVDGEPHWGSFDMRGMPSNGGIVLTLDDTEDLPSLPTPRGIDSVTVLSLADEEVLFEDDFEGGPSPNWVVTGEAAFGAGLFGSKGSAEIALPGQDWRDYRVIVKSKNVQSFGLTVRARDDRYGIVTTVRPFHWNEDATKWVSVTNGFPGAEGPGRDIELSRTQSLKSLTAMLTRPYPYMVLLGVILLLSVLALQMVPKAVSDEARDMAQMVPPRAGALFVAIVGLTVLLYYGASNREHMPFVPDSIAYVFQAKIFASFQLTTDPPPVHGAFDFFVPAPFALTDDSWAAQYPFAHPLMLAMGQLLNAPWFIPPLLGAASIGLIYRVGRNVYNERSGVLAAALLATSPFFIMNVTNLMSHNTAGFFLLTCLMCITLMDRRPVLFGVLSGVAFGLLLNTRPLTALALTVPFGALLVVHAYHAKSRSDGLKQVGAFAAGGAIMAVLFLGWNYTITGDPFTTGYQTTGVTFFDSQSLSAPTQGEGFQSESPGDALGVSGSHDSAQGIQNERIQMALLLLVLHGWPVLIGLTFSLLPFLLGSRYGYDWFFLACASMATGVWVLYESTGVMYGPRYWYEAMPFLLLLAARGCDRAADLLASGSGMLAERRVEPRERPFWAARLVMFAFVAILVALSVYSWTLGNRTPWRAELTPSSASAMCCVLDVDDRIHRLVEERGVHNALVLVDPCGNNFVCYGSVFWRNSANLDGDVVYAKDIVALRQEIIAAYPGRDVYLATYYDEATLTPLGARP